jgi:uncharacterized RDD family membrane protein YckC
MKSKEKTGALAIKTPEGIVFSLQLAGPVSRFSAWLIDAASIFTLSLFVRLLLGFLNILSRDIASAAVILAYFLIPIAYGIIMEWYWRGQTIGKRLFRLRVMDEHGLRLQFSQVVIRNLLRAVDSFPVCYMAGGLSCLISRHSQRLGDMAANTIVVRLGDISEPNLDQIFTDKYNSFRDYPHLEARLRHHVSPEEAGIALQALIRRNDLTPQARIELFKEIASHFRSIVRFPQEATDGISDEQYVRNVAEVLFRSHEA